MNIEKSRSSSRPKVSSNRQLLSFGSYERTSSWQESSPIHAIFCLQSWNGDHTWAIQLGQGLHGMIMTLGSRFGREPQEFRASYCEAAQNEVRWVWSWSSLRSRRISQLRGFSTTTIWPSQHESTRCSQQTCPHSELGRVLDSVDLSSPQPPLFHCIKKITPDFVLFIPLPNTERYPLPLRSAPPYIISIE